MVPSLTRSVTAATRARAVSGSRKASVGGTGNVPVRLEPVGRLRLEGQGDVIGDEDRLEAAGFRLARDENQVLARRETAVAGQMPAEVHGSGRA